MRWLAFLGVGCSSRSSRVELTLRLGHEPVLCDLWAEYTRRHPDAVRGVREMIERGLVVCASGKPTTTAPAESPLELVPGWWRRLERMRPSLAG
jgi:hypothetical protein